MNALSLLRSVRQQLPDMLAHVPGCPAAGPCTCGFETLVSRVDQVLATLETALPEARRAISDAHTALLGLRAEPGRQGKVSEAMEGHRKAMAALDQIGGAA